MARNDFTRRDFLKASGTGLGALLFSRALQAGMKGEDRPNILWVVSEDTSPWLGCYGDEVATTPHLDKMASEGVLYENAFANAPVCAPARCTIITGMYASSLGTLHMRSRYDIPDFAKYFPLLMRAAGYYCTNNSKTDYNTEKVPGTWQDAWNESSGKAHYKNRKEGQPFFAVFNYGASHESVLFQDDDNLGHDPSEIDVAPYHPDLPEVRKDMAEYYDGIEKIDQQIGRRIEELEERGVADNTIVFYYGDHGGVLARSKRYLFDSGTHVPMIVQFPEKWRHLAPADPGSRVTRPVSFVDLAPTVLSLVGVDVPDHIQGEAFLGHQQEKPRRYVPLFRGRMDERYDMMRAMRSKRYLYIRNYMPHRIYGQHLNYLWRAQSTQAWEKAYENGECNETQSRFWQTKPPEELYDVYEDPHNVNNLADDPEYQGILKEMRQANLDHVLEVGDPGFLPEGEMLRRAEQAGCSPHELAHRADFPLERIVMTAEMATRRDPKHLDELITRLRDEDSGVRYWAATGCAVLGEKAERAADALQNVLDDESGDVRVSAAEALCRMGHMEKGLAALKKTLSHEEDKVVLRAVNVVQSLGEPAKPLIDTVRKTLDRGGYVKRAAEWAVESMG